MNAIVQILLATYNGEKFLEEQIESLLHQTFNKIEIICRDDGSTDNTMVILNKYKKMYPDKIRIINDDDKIGNAKGNFMKLLSVADAPYIMFCDQDDYWFPEKVEQTLKVMNDENNNCPLLVYSDYIMVNEELKPYSFKKSQNQIYKGYTDLRHLLVQNYVTGCTLMLNKLAYTKLYVSSPDILMHDWWAALYVSASGRIIHIDKPLMYYRQHENNQVGAVNVKSVKYIVSRLGDSKSKESMGKYVSQAKILLNVCNIIDPTTKKSLEYFVDIPNHNKLIRIWMLIKGKYFKSTLIRMLGQIYYV